MKPWCKVDPQAPTPRADFIRVWLNELYYGEHKQCTDSLCHVYPDGSKSFCCLGLGSMLFGYSLNNVIKRNDYAVVYMGGEAGVLPKTIAKFLKMDVSGELRNYDNKNCSEKAQMTELKTFIEKQAPIRFIPSSLVRMNDRIIPFYVIALVIREFATSLFRDLTPEELGYVQSTKLEGKHNV